MTFQWKSQANANSMRSTHYVEIVQFPQSSIFNIPATSMFPELDQTVPVVFAFAVSCIEIVLDMDHTWNSKRENLQMNL